MRISTLFFTLIIGATMSTTALADRLEIWRIVQDQCTRVKIDTGLPGECESVDMPAGERLGFAILKEANAATNFLLVPTGRIVGIEDPMLLRRGATNYFAEAWRATDFVSAAAGHTLPRERLSLEVDSIIRRKQDQMYIHIACLKADVVSRLRKVSVNIGGTWSPLSEEFGGASWQAMRIMGDDMADFNPFLLLADGIPGARDDMGLWTLVVTGTSDSNPSFLLLASRADMTAVQNMSGDTLQERDCNSH